jgi:hypothetical protein
VPSGVRILAYLVAGIPAAIGVAFVARYAYVTSDTADAGLASAALYAMTAAGAFGGPAAAIAVGNKGRPVAAFCLGCLALLAIAGNWTNTLGAITQRGAAKEAAANKARDDKSRDENELARLIGARGALPKFAPTDADAVAAARAAVEAAERSRSAECGNGDPKQRGPNCRLRETDEATARTALTAATTNKAQTDVAAKLEAEVAVIRARLAKSNAPASTNALGEALSRVLPISAASAATLQQGFMSAVVELLIAAALALPELLRAPKEPAQKRADDPTTAPTVEGEPSQPITFGDVRRFMLACIPRASGQEVAWGTIYGRYQRWCAEQSPPVAALELSGFAAKFKTACERAGIRTRRDGSRVYCVDVQLVA